MIAHIVRGHQTSATVEAFTKILILFRNTYFFIFGEYVD